MKRILLLAFILLVLVACFFGYTFLRPAVSPGDKDGQFLYIKTGDTYEDLKANLTGQHYIGGSGFNLVSKILKFDNPHPGRYKVSKGMSLYSLVRMLKSGRQSIVKMVIIKERTKELFAGRFGRGKRYDSETDSLAMIGFLTNTDSLKHFNVDTNTVMSVVMPFTYELNWNSTPSKIFRQYYAAYRNFWNEDRREKAKALGLTETEVMTLASIVDEETNKKEDKYNIASTYLNRMKTGMRLQADPTVKFALKDFGLKRVTGKHLAVESPFNTYQHTGLPPGPICTPSIETIEAVLNAPQTDYLYFVASDKFDGSSIFTTNITDHQKYAKLYQQALNRRFDSLLKAKAQ